MKTHQQHFGIKRLSGFTLIELLTVVIIIGVVLAIGVPSFREVIQNQRMGTQINELVSDLNYARSEAIKRNSNISTCMRNVAGTACIGGASWLGGWLVFNDPNDNGTVDGGEIILKVRDAITGMTSFNFSGGTRVRYDSQGFARGFAGTLTLCDTRGNTKRKGITISNTGRVRRSVAADMASC